MKGDGSISLEERILEALKSGGSALRHSMKVTPESHNNVSEWIDFFGSFPINYKFQLQDDTIVVQKQTCLIREG
jgi:hypothetical protein